jgi:hypothetical protein
MKEVLSKRAGRGAATQAVREHDKALQRRHARFETTNKRLEAAPRS